MQIVNRGTKKSNKKLLIIMVFLIICNTIFIFHYFKKTISPKVVEVSEREINRLTYSFIVDYTDTEYLNSQYLDDILKITQNSSGEIMYVDFNLDNAYIVLDKLTRKMQDGLYKFAKGEVDKKYYDEYLTTKNDKMLLFVPLGMLSTNPFLTNLGPRIPVKINIVNTLITNLKTKITNYGLNNALIEVYAYIWVVEELTTPVTFKEIKIEYDCLIAAKMINGRVPSLYGDVLESESGLINIPMN